jgi:prepilin-type N-terminal cleavage/methylation domain-containing protein
MLPRQLRAYGCVADRLLYKRPHGVTSLAPFAFKGSFSRWRTGSTESLMNNQKKGFTIIELLMVVIVIGILAVIMIPKFADSKEKAYVAQMKSDLRNFATYEEQYAADNGGHYFAGSATMAAPLNGFHTSLNVTITASAVVGPPPSWSATAAHQQTARTCDMTTGLITCP